MFDSLSETEQRAFVAGQLKTQDFDFAHHKKLFMKIMYGPRADNAWSILVMTAKNRETV